METGLRTTRPSVKQAGFVKADIQAGQFFILGGRTAYVAEVGEPIKAPNGETDARLPLIYSNATESDLLLRPLQRALYKEHRAVLHKIGVTGGSVERRVAGARLDPTYLMADVEIVATYELYRINRAKLETLIHKVFGAARLDVEIMDRFGRPIVPKEWFLVPLFAVEAVVNQIRDGTITGLVYDPRTASLVRG